MILKPGVFNYVIIPLIPTNGFWFHMKKSKLGSNYASQTIQLWPSLLCIQAHLNYQILMSCSCGKIRMPFLCPPLARLSVSAICKAAAEPVRQPSLMPPCHDEQNAIGLCLFALASVTAVAQDALQEGRVCMEPLGRLRFVPLFVGPQVLQLLHRQPEPLL